MESTDTVGHVHAAAGNSIGNCMLNAWCTIITVHSHGVVKNGGNVT